MTEFAWVHVAWVSGVLAVATTIQGVAGFGFMLIAAAGLIQVYPAQLVVPGLALVYVPLGVAQTIQVRRDVDTGLLVPWTAGGLVGLLPGTLVLTAVDSLTMKRGIGLTMIVLSLLLKLRPGLPFRRERAARFCAGILGGALGASTSVAGPPIVLFGIKQRWAVEAFRATLLCYFLILSAIIVVFQYQFGLVTADTAVWAAGGLPGCAVGFVAATRLRGLVDGENFRRIGIGLVFAGGLSALLL